MKLIILLLAMTTVVQADDQGVFWIYDEDPDYWIFHYSEGDVGEKRRLDHQISASDRSAVFRDLKDSGCLSMQAVKNNIVSISSVVVCYPDELRPKQPVITGVWRNE